MNEIADETGQFAGACDEPGRIKGRCVGHRITIEAPPELVWDFVADFQGWSSWNPFYSDTLGSADEGGTVHFAVHLEGLKPQKNKAQVSKVRPNELLEYRLSSFGGLVKAFRFIEIEELSPIRCRVGNGEILGGPLGPVIARAVGPKVAAGLRDMNEALKAIAERKWRGQRG